MHQKAKTEACGVAQSWCLHAFLLRAPDVPAITHGNYIMVVSGAHLWNLRASVAAPMSPPGTGRSYEIIQYLFGSGRSKVDPAFLDYMEPLLLGVCLVAAVGRS